MGFGLSKALGNITNVALPGVGSALGSTGGYDSGSAILSGIPYIGDSFAAQQQQQFESGEAATARDFSDQQALRQMQFQERMSNTAHQRQIEDMKKAGLNPILSAGAGASTPSGASGATVSAKGTKAQGGKSSDLTTSLIKGEHNKISSETVKNDTQADLNTTTNDLNKEKVQTEKIRQQEVSNSAKKIEADTKSQQLQNVIRAGESDFEKDWGKYYRNTNKLLNLLNQATGSARDASTIYRSIQPSEKDKQRKDSENRSNKLRDRIKNKSFKH